MDADDSPRRGFADRSIFTRFLPGASPSSFCLLLHDSSFHGDWFHAILKTYVYLHCQYWWPSNTRQLQVCLALVYLCCMNYIGSISIWLVVWNLFIPFSFFQSGWNFIIPIEEIICFRGVGWSHQPLTVLKSPLQFNNHPKWLIPLRRVETTNQYLCVYIYIYVCIYIYIY